MKEKAIKIIRTIQENNYHALIVGGAVRDSIINIHPKDYDIVTNCPVNKLKELFTDVITVGESFGVLIINKHFEVAQFRVDDYRSGELEVKEIDYSKYCLKELIKLDSSRRDLRSNAIYHDPISDKYYDPQDGIRDLEEGYIRFVGDAQTRVEEDPIRLLRFYRFRGKFPHMKHWWNDWDDVEGLGYLLKKVSMERIF